MSVTVHVRHFFNEEGLRALPRLFEEHQRCLSAFPGFVSLHHSTPVRHEQFNELEMTLEFTDEALLKQWRSSAEHARVAATYRRYWVREPEVTFSALD